MPSVVTINTSGGSGSGFFVSSRVVITNRHVVGASTSVRVTTSSGKSYESSSIFIAPDHDLAAVKVECENCPSLLLAEPASIAVGQEVIAIGSPGLGGITLRNSVTRGIVSAFRRSNDSDHVYIQTDTSINPGNSGGPLLDRWGNVLGVNTLKLVKDGYEGLNFAISSGDVLSMLERRLGYRPERGKPSTLLA